jgi:hypothetical protein
MELDSGSDGAITLGNHAADVMPSEKDQKGRSIVSLHIPGIPDVKGSAVVRDLIMDGNLGVPVLRRWVVTIDLARERLWIAPRPEAEPTSK